MCVGGEAAAELRKHPFLTNLTPCVVVPGLQGFSDVPADRVGLQLVGKPVILMWKQHVEYIKKAQKIIADLKAKGIIPKSGQPRPEDITNLIEALKPVGTEFKAALEAEGIAFPEEGETYSKDEVRATAKKIQNALAEEGIINAPKNGETYTQEEMIENYKKVAKRLQEEGIDVPSSELEESVTASYPCTGQQPSCHPREYVCCDCTNWNYFCLYWKGYGIGMCFLNCVACLATSPYHCWLCVICVFFAWVLGLTDPTSCCEGSWFWNCCPIPG
ncbi:MAG: hypothetical protein ACTSYO_09450 [Candidatus Ranarchaeia archaeon]